MAGKLGSWVALGVVIVAALMLGTVASAVASAPGHSRPLTTYTLAVTESGLPGGTTWSFYYYGTATTYTGSTATIKVTGLSATGAYVYTNPVTVGSTVRYQPMPSQYTYVTIPNTLHVTVLYQTQYYESFAVSPTSSGTANPGTNWYALGSTLPIAAQAAVGDTFSKWTASPTSAFTIANSKLESTTAVVNKVGTLTALFTVAHYAPIFDEVGLPASTGWSVLFNGASHVGTGTSITVPSIAAGTSYPWSVADVSSGSGIQYAPNPAGGNMNVPFQASQEIVFVKQYKITIAINPSPSGSTNPGVGFAYYNGGINIPILASNGGGDVFSKWTVDQTKLGLGNVKSSGTNATVKSSTKLTANFVPGTLCTTCSVTFSEIGLPTGTPWSVSFNGGVYLSSSPSMTVTGVTTASYWTAGTQIGAGQSGVAYFPNAPNSAYWYVGSASKIQVVYQKFDYVSFDTHPFYGTGAPTVSTGWFLDGAMNALSVLSSATYNFKSWSSSSPNVTLASTSSASTTFTPTGPATVTASFVQPTSKLHFQEYGLPTGTVWGVVIGGTTYYSNTVYDNVSAVGWGSTSWSATTTMSGGAGIQWDALDSSGSVVAPYQTYQAVVYAEAVLVSWAVAGAASSGASVTPSGTTTYYYIGSVWPIWAENGTSSPSSFTWSQTAGTATIVSTSSYATFATILATGTITGNFA
ncbi:MAG: hypothetical protein L3K10_06745 [Thermoplasmata archaeon]|nr:hypothetical protein [Thermoplasmata archaeon]